MCKKKKAVYAFGELLTVSKSRDQPGERYTTHGEEEHTSIRTVNESVRRPRRVGAIPSSGLEQLVCSPPIYDSDISGKAGGCSNYSSFSSNPPILEQLEHYEQLVIWIVGLLVSPSA